MEDKEIAPSSSHCWHCCGIDESKRGELLRPCNCVDKFIHVYCLKKIANTENILHCPFCNACYPLEVRPKPLLKMLLKAFILFCMILLTILINFVIIIIAAELFKYVGFSLITQAIIINIIYWFIYDPWIDIVDWSKRIYILCHQWYKSTYEWNLIRSTNNIEE